jgi:hypothetical protein
MKVRTCFVSNSSSSSFVCCICGEEVSGMDMGLYDAEMCCCENGHQFCQMHLINQDHPCDVKDYYKEVHHFESYQDVIDNDNEDVEYQDFLYSVPKIYCPVCQMQEVSTDDINSYLLKLSGKSYQEIKEQMKTFKDYDSLRTFIQKEE